MVIYKTTNLINNKWYIGQDKHNNPKYLGSGKLLTLAVLKYGKNNFVKEILQECESVDHLNKAEEEWIDLLNAVEDKESYNLRRGGLRYPERFGKDNHNFGVYPKHMTDKTKRKVTCLNDSRTFDSLTEAAGFYNISVCKINSICRYNRISHKGFKFRYFNEESVTREKKNKKNKEGYRPFNCKKILCVELQAVFFSTESVVQFCISSGLKTNRASIRRVCNLQYKKAAGLTWRWYV
jgi:hypothetical protein